MSDGPSLTDIAAELCTTPRAHFVTTRNARAKEAGDAGIAAEIRALRKPSASAWVVNVFASERPDELGEALRLAAELREAQDDLDAKALAQLGRDRRALTNRLTADAVALAERAGERVTVATADAVRQTLSAAFFDPTAAAAVASGRLLRALEPGVTSNYSEDIVSGGAAELPDVRSVRVDEVAARRERKAAQRALRDAEQKHERAQNTAAQSDRALRDSVLHADGLEARAGELEAEIAEIRALAAHARAEAAAAATTQEEAALRATEAADAVATARTALDALQ